MNLLQLIKTRRSVRKYDPTKPVTEEQINQILEAAIWAPNAGNTQCWRFYVVRNPQVKEDLATRAGHQPFAANAPVLIVVCADLNQIGEKYGERGRETYALQDTAAAIQNMQLAITDLGLASCWIGSFDEARAAEILNLPAGVRPLSLLPIGYAADQPKPPARRTVEEVVVRID